MQNPKLAYLCRTRFVLGLFCFVLAASALPLLATEEQEPVSKPEEPAKKPKYFLLPMEIDTDSGAANGDAIIGRILPANSIPLGDKWRLLNIAIINIADAPGGRPGSPGNPESSPGEQVFGLGDISDALLFTKKGAKLGLGLIFGLPTATDDVLGSGKWSAGPAFKLSHQTGPWVLSLLAGNLRAFAGDDDRPDIHQMIVRVLVRRTFGEKWFFIYSPIITANWNAASSQRWLVPLGGGFGRHMAWNTPLNISLQAYYNVIKPDGAPKSVFRIGFTIPFRIPERFAVGYKP